MKKKQIKVKYTKLGLANFYGGHGNYIEINEKLKYNKKLRDLIVKHELGHKKDFDLHYEIKEAISLVLKPKVVFSLLWLCLTTPSSWIDILPIQIRNKKIVYDLNLLILYLFIGLLFYLSIKIFF
jgi:hypothetical protein